MGNVLSCCFRQDSDENDPLLQEQDRYGSQAQLDYNEMEQRQKERVLARELELTEIVNNTNDKLIDIGMISNSGIVASSHDLGSSYVQDQREILHDVPLTVLPSSKIKQDTRKAIQEFHKKYFANLVKNLTVEYNKPLVANIES
ncbi:Meh1p [Kluyveromyces lactis]|uniref:KLLA0A02937p n=1 Tax=Kluyveromyces lactis (strain ATCC 8585 / CBS 2359 / DSM 70799 / NBRC 1267 / NRRL Y-1140 / WM37) TaxID=284590 RepID=Q6CY61_KLULA|nr:uncharacterized protein KLLA0_A02937g [Kluyveromyces lactis]CAH02716.1 KLLA0A02937p [Kluyveromyces lactis]|eukprot:XP_451128.1 uncharacterized protein KLLA0_A02937g [Kluyveromyces lactis]